MYIQDYNITFSLINVPLECQINWKNFVLLVIWLLCLLYLFWIRSELILYMYIKEEENIFKQIKNLHFLEIYAVFVWGEHSAKDLAWGENWQIVWIFMQPAFSYCRQSLQVELSNFNLTLLWQWTLHLEILDMLSRLALEHLFNVTLILLVAFCVDYFQRCRNWTLGGRKDAGHS